MHEIKISGAFKTNSHRLFYELEKLEDFDWNELITEAILHELDKEIPNLDVLLLVNEAEFTVTLHEHDERTSI